MKNAITIDLNIFITFRLCLTLFCLALITSKFCAQCFVWSLLCKTRVMRRYRIKVEEYKAMSRIITNVYSIIILSVARANLQNVSCPTLSTLEWRNVIKQLPMAMIHVESSKDARIFFVNKVTFKGWTVAMNLSTAIKNRLRIETECELYFKLGDIYDES